MGFSSHRSVALTSLTGAAVVFSSSCSGKLNNASEVGDAGTGDVRDAYSSSSGSGSDSGSDSSDVTESRSGSGSGGLSGSSGGGGDSDAVPVSCAFSGPGITNCGASSESCCTSLEVTGGTYERTYTNSGGGPSGEADPASVSSFRLDKYVVTVGRFRQFVNAWNNGTGYMPPAASGKQTHLNGGQGLANSGSPGTYEPGWVASDDSEISLTDANLASIYCSPSVTWTPSAGSNETLPMNCENWFEAYAFCIWDGGFLPSEAEWEYAAAGGYQQREYPWGSTAPGINSQYAIYGCYYPSGSADASVYNCAGNVSSIAPVGTARLGAGLWGQLDLEGDVYEWNLDWYAPYVSPCMDCADLSVGSNRVYRGARFDNIASNLLPPNRYNYGPTDRLNMIGFRCARTP
jgi:formylglycine-generating enzyme required for sulfatase activity